MPSISPLVELAELVRAWAQTWSLLQSNPPLWAQQKRSHHINCVWQVAGELRGLKQHRLKCLYPWAAQGLLQLPIRPAVKLINSFRQTCPTESTLWYPESQKGALPLYIGLGIPWLLLDHHKPEDLHAEAEEDVKHNREQQWGWDELAWRPVGDQLWIGTCETHWNMHRCVYWCKIQAAMLCNTDYINDTFTACNILNKTYKDCIKYKTQSCFLTKSHWHRRG